MVVLSSHMDCSCYCRTETAFWKREVACLCRRCSAPKESWLWYVGIVNHSSWAKKLICMCFSFPRWRDTFLGTIWVAVIKEDFQVKCRYSSFLCAMVDMNLQWAPCHPLRQPACLFAAEGNDTFWTLLSHQVSAKS